MNDSIGVWGRSDLMAIAAVRYCMGRSSYIVGDCADWLVATWTKLEPSARAVIKRDLAEEIQRDDEAWERGDAHHPLGMRCDRAQWDLVMDVIKIHERAAHETAYAPCVIARELLDTAAGIARHGNALRVAKELPGANDEIRGVLDSWASGRPTDRDKHLLPRIAVFLARKEDVDCSPP